MHILGDEMTYDELKDWIRINESKIFEDGAVGTGCIIGSKEITWAITKRCNLRCKYCFIDEWDSGELTTEEGFELIEDLVKLGYNKLALDGGEPLMREDIYEFIEYASSYNIMVAIGTNGTLITREIAEKLKEAGLKRASISVDGVDEAHNELRGEGIFRDTARGIEACKDVGLGVQFFMVVTRYNYEEIPKVIKFAENLDINRIILEYLIPIGRGENVSEACLSPDENRKLFDYMINKQMETDVWLKPLCNPQYWFYLKERGLVDRKDFMGCPAATNRLRILPNGDVTPCPYLPVSGGNIREESLSDIIEDSEVFKAIRARRLGGRCATCKYKEECGGCRARAYAMHGGYSAEDPVCLVQSK